MTIQELYAKIGADYERGLQVLRVDKLLDKHIRKLPKNGVVEKLIEAGDSMDPTQLFETAHAVKGVCANLGLVRLSEAASEIAEEFRPGNPRRFTDEQVAAKLRQIAEIYANTKAGIQEYEEQA